MNLFEFPALAVFTAVLVAGCEARQTPAARPADETKGHDAPAARRDDETNKIAQGFYATLASLRMSCDADRNGGPLVSLQGAFGRAAVRLTLAQDRQGIAVELRGDGHAANDPVTFLKELKTEQADLFGHSLGGTLALGVATKHPRLVCKLAIGTSR